MRLQERFVGVGVVALLTLFAVPTLAFAQSGSGIAGIVKDTTGAVLPGVTVEASSPALIEKVRAVVTDGAGQYKIIDLRPGVYVVTFSLPGFGTLKREGIELTSEFTATVNGEMAVGTLGETVTVSGQSPVVDTQNVRQQQVVTGQVIDALPTGKTFQSFAALVPGMVSGSSANGASQDVGGVAGEGGRLAIHGGALTDMIQVIDGLMYNSFNVSTSGLRTNTGMVQEFNYQLGGISAEYFTGGVVMNIIQKDGGNRFVGSVFGNYASGALQSNNLTNDLRARGLAAVNSLEKIWDVNPSFGGPIIQDELWFFGSTRYWGANDRAAGLFHATDPRAPVYVPDLSRQALIDIWTFSQDLRLKWQVTPKNRLSAYVVNQPRRSLSTGQFGVGIIRTPEALPFQDVHRNVYTQESWASTVSNRLLLEAAVGIYKQGINAPLEPGVTTDMYPILELSTNLAYGSPQSYNKLDWRSETYRVALSYVTGSHAFKVGGSLQHARGANSVFVNNDINLNLLRGVPSSITLNTTPRPQVTMLNAMAGLFAQDQWTVKRFTLNGGIRFDYHDASVPAQQVPAARFVGARDFPEVPHVPHWADLSPRLGVAYDLFGTGKTALKVTLNRYVGAQLYELAVANDPLNTSVNTASRTWTDLNGNFTPQCDFLDPAPNGECGRLSNLNFGKPNITTRYDPAYLEGFGKRDYNWETSVAVQHELRPQVALNAAYFRRWYGNFTVTDNLDVTPADYDPYCITSPLDSRLPGGGGQQICGFYDLKPEKFGLVHNLVTSAKSYGTQTQVYDGVDVGINARLQHGAFVQGGLNAGRTRSNTCFVVDSPQLRFCDVRPPFQASFRLLGMYPLPWDVQLSGTFQSNPGPQITATYVATNAEIAPTLGRNLSAGVAGTARVELIAPGTMYEERMNQVDLRLAKGVRVGLARVRGIFDLYNVFNASPVLGLFTTYGSAWQRPTQILSGRLIKFSAQVDF